MTDLRRTVRLTAERGAQMYAVVEDIIYGLATVRLASGGARLTSLPVLGATVTVGDTVIVDYSAEGKPYVRPLTIPYDEEIVEPDVEFFSEDEQPVDTGLEVARITISAPYTFSTGWTCGAGCNPWGHYLRFNKPIYDPAGMMGLYGLVPQTPGRYLVRWSAAISPPEGAYGQGLRLMMAPSQSGTRMGGSRWRRWKSNGDNDWVLISGSTIATLDTNDVVYVYLQAEWGTQVVVGDEPQSTVTVLVDDGRYPILEMYKLCGLSSGDKAQREWYWNE